MLKNEKKCTIILSTMLVGLFIILGKMFGSYSYFYIITIPLYILSIILINKKAESREKIELAVNSCIEESEFDVIDKIEQLRMYFKDTTDVIEYLTVVDSKVLTYVFNKNSLSLCYKEYILGAIKCLTIFKNFKGNCYQNIDIFSIPENEKISTLLSTIYMVSKQIDSGSSTIYITSRQKDNGVFIDVTDRYNSSIEGDLFCKRLLSMFSTKKFVLTAKLA